MIPILPLLVLVGAHLASADPVFLNVTLHCDHKADWCAKLYIYEHDMPRENDILLYSNECYKGPIFNKLQGPYYPNGDWWGEYDLNFVVTHTCTDNGETACIGPKDDKWAPLNGPSVTQFDIDLTNHGKLGGCDHPNKDPYGRG